MKWNTILTLILVAAMTNALTLQTGLIFEGTDNRITLTREYNTTLAYTFKNSLGLNGVNITLTPNTGFLNSSFNAYNQTYMNFTHTPNESMKVEHNVTGLKESLNYLLTAPIVEDSDTSTGGMVSLTSSTFSGETEYLIIQDGGVVGCTDPHSILLSGNINSITANFIFNSTSQYQDFTCQLNDLDGECIYSGGNLSSLKFPVSNTTSNPFSTCNVTFYTPLYSGEYTTIVSESQSFNQTNLDVGNFSKIKYVRRYYENATSGWW